MIALPVGYTAVRWTGPSIMIVDMPNLSSISRIYAHNRITGSGYIGYQKGRKYPTLSVLMTGEDYLVDALVPFTLDAAVASPDGAFSAFDGYTPPTGVTAPVPTGSIPGTVNSQTAATTIIGGRLVARLADGLVPYSTLTTDMRYQLFGFALNSALAGGTVQVQRNGYVTYPGLGLIPGATLFAGDNGQIVYSNAGMAVHHVIGRAETDDSFSFTASYTTIKIA